MIVVVSGLPRSGTSLMMQMLVAGGIPALTDGAREPDEDNPRGYFEWERIRTLPQDPNCILEAEGKAVKVISSLLRFLPPGPQYKILFIRRAIAEVVASQAVMISRRRNPMAPDPSAVHAAMEAHSREVTAWLRTRLDLETCWIEHATLLTQPRLEAEKIIKFLGRPLELERMLAQIDPSLHRHKS